MKRSEFFEITTFFYLKKKKHSSCIFVLFLVYNIIHQVISKKYSQIFVLSFLIKKDQTLYTMKRINKYNEKEDILLTINEIIPHLRFRRDVICFGVSVDPNEVGVSLDVRDHLTFSFIFL